MSNPTTPFSWQMPTATDLVTDLPADFEVFGQAVATSMADLLGGTTGQILSKTTNADMDFTWVSAAPGDITGVTAGTGISGGGTSGDVTITNDMATTITASGDIIVGTGSGTYDNLPIGTTGQILTADTTVSPYKVKWATPAGGGGKVLQVVQGTLTTNASTSAGSFQDTGLTVTITPSSATSKIYVTATVPEIGLTASGSTTSSAFGIQLVRTSTALQSGVIGTFAGASSANREIYAPFNFSYLDSPATTSATTYKVQMVVNTGTTVTTYNSGVKIASIVVMEIGA